MRGLLIGRFQPFHLGHLEVAEHLRAAHPRETILFGIGSSQVSYTFENPFTAAERAEMIDRALTQAGLANWASVPVPDIDRHALWVEHVREIVPPFERVYTNNPLTRRLFERADVPVEATPMFDRETRQGAIVRTRMATGGEWASLVPPAVARYLEEIGGPGRLAMLSEESGAPAPRGRPKGPAAGIK